MNHKSLLSSNGFGQSQQSATFNKLFEVKPSIQIKILFFACCCVFLFTLNEKTMAQEVTFSFGNHSFTLPQSTITFPGGGGNCPVTVCNLVPNGGFEAGGNGSLYGSCDEVYPGCEFDNCPPACWDFAGLFMSDRFDDNPVYNFGNPFLPQTLGIRT